MDPHVGGLRRLAGSVVRAGARFVTAIRARGLVSIVAVATLVYLVLAPLVMVVLSSFRLTDRYLPFEQGATWSLANYISVFGRPETYLLIVNTLFFAVGALGLAFAVALVLAWLTERTDLPLRNVLYVLVVASVGVPGIVYSISWALLGNPRTGQINLVLRGLLGLEDATGPLDLFTLPGLVLVQGLRMVPVTYLFIASALRAMDPGLEEAASTSGAKFTQVLRRISLPILTPTFLSVLIYQFVTVVESFEAALIIGLRGGIRLLSTQIWLDVQVGAFPNFGLASTYSILLLAIALGPLIVYNRLLAAPGRFATISGKGYRPRRMKLGPWRFVGLSFASIYVVLTFLIRCSASGLGSAKNG